VVGLVESVREPSLTLTSRRGQRVNVDVSAIDRDIRRELKPGDRVTVFAPNRDSGSPVASGILVDHAATPAASPRWAARPISRRRAAAARRRGPVLI
jgi:hypothetical protein